MILNRLFWFVTGFSHSRWKIFSSWKLLVLYWKSSNIAPFMEHIFNAENVLNLACWFLFDTSCLNSIFKTWILCAPRKRYQYFFFVEHRIFSIFNVLSVWILDCWFYFETGYPNSTWKRLYSKSSRCSAQQDINMAPWKMAWIFVDFDLSMITRIPYVKHTNCENSWSAKEASILLRSWNILSI